MSAYIAHNMNGNEELPTDLETTMSEVTTAQKLTKQGANLLRKIEEEKEASQTEARRQAKKQATMATKKKKTEKETICL